MRMQLFYALARAASSFLGTALRMARQLFHETTGALFVTFAVVGATAAWREWHKGSAQWLVGVAVGFALMMTAFAVASFRSARRVR
jgi:glycerol uptake facilitator-like aquaporin